MPFPTRSGSRAGTAGRECPAKNAETMISAVYYIFLVLLCTFFMILSALALVVCYPFDKGRRVVHELSRILVRTFFAIPPRWRQRVEGLEHVDRKKSYVIVLNHNTVIDIPTLYYIPLNFRWVSKREVFKTPFFGQYLILHGDICINRGRASEALEQMVRDGKLWISRGASVAVFPGYAFERRRDTPLQGGRLHAGPGGGRGDTPRGAGRHQDAYPQERDVQLGQPHHHPRAAPRTGREGRLDRDARADGGGARRHERGPCPDPKPKIDYGRFTQYQS